MERYGRVIRDDNWKYKDKIPYDKYRALYGVDKGVIVDEFADNENLYFYDDIGDLIAVFTPDADFHEYFYSVYYSWHSDYCPYLRDYEEDKDMATTTNIAFNTYAEPAEYTLNDYLTWNKYDGNTISSTKSNSVYINDINVEQALKDLAKTAEAVGPAFEVVGSEMKKLVNKNEKEKDDMTGFNFDFGPCTGDKVRMSVYGLAVQNARGEWQSYDEKTGQVMNVDLLNFDGRKFMYKVPVAVSAVEKGDIVIHNCLPMIVLDNDDTGLIVVDVKAGEEKKILPVKSPFGFDFITKIVSLFNAFSDAPTPDAPFGNFLPFLMMGENGKDVDPFAMCLMMQQTGGAATNLFNNPMMMYFLMKDNKSGNDWFLPMMLMNQSPAQQKTVRK